MEFRKHAVIIALSLLIADTVIPGNRSNFLSHGPSSSAFGRGEISIPAADITASYYNPSHLADMPRDNFNFTHFQLFEGSMYDYAGIGFRRGNGFAFGFSALNLRSGDIELRQTINDTPQTTNTSQSAFAGMFSAAVPRMKGLRAGLAVKYALQRLQGYSSGSIAADIGLSGNCRGPSIFGRETSVSSGLSCLNLVRPKFTLVADEESFPSILLFESAFSIPLTFAYDRGMNSLYFDDLTLLLAAKNEDERTSLKYGAEYAVNDKYFFRAGTYDSRFTFGMGYTVSDYSIDYAADISELAVLHRLGVTYAFGRNRSEAGTELNDGRMPVSSPVTLEDKDRLMQEALLKQEEERIERKRIERETAPAISLARKEYGRKYYLSATDRLKEILIKYPSHEAAEKLLEEISSLMQVTAKNIGNADFEDIFYSKAYISYYGKAYEDALNQWEKALELDPDRKEVLEYSVRVKAYFADAEALEMERAAENAISKLFEDGVKHYDNGKLVQCIRKMEKVKKSSEESGIKSSFEWINKADNYIQMSIEELSKTVSNVKDTGESEADRQEREIDIKTAGKKYDQGLIFYAQGKLSNAARMWEIALRFDPDNQKAKQALDKVRQELNEGKTVK